MRSLLGYLEDRPIIFALLCGALPYVALRLYMSRVMHGEAMLAEAPGTASLASLAAVGIAIRSIFLAVELRRLLLDRDSLCAVRSSEEHSWFAFARIESPRWSRFDCCSR